MVIDFHTHIFPDKIAARTIVALAQQGNLTAYTNGSLGELRESMDKAGVDLSVVLPVVTRPEQFRTVNRFAAGLNDRVGETGILSFGGMHPGSSSYKEELREIQNLGIKGIKLHPDYQRTFFDDIQMIRVMDYAASLGLIMVIHAGCDYGRVTHCTPRRVRNVLEQIQPPGLVLAHMGGNEYADEAEELLCDQDVYMDTAFVLGRMEEEQLLRMIRKVGAERVLFATDSPWKDQKADVAYLRGLDLTAEERGMILSGNARRLLGISE